MNKRTRRRRMLSLLATVVVAAAVGLVFDATNALRGVELASVDARFDLRGTQPAPSDVVVVAIDQRTIEAAGGGAYPINRKRDAEVIGRLVKAGAAVIAYDVQFTDPTDDPDADDAIIQAVADAPRVVLGTKDVGSDGTTGIFGGEDGLAYSKATPANTHLALDLDGRLRTMPFKQQKLESFAMAAARLQKPRLAKPAGNAFWIDFPGPAGTIRTLSFRDVERGRFRESDIRGKVVVVGPTAPRQGQFTRTSTSDRMAAPEIQAAAITTALAGFPLRAASPWLDALLVIILAALGPLAALRFGRVGAVLAPLVGAVAFLIGAKLAFDGGTMLAVVPALAAALVGATGGVAFADAERSPMQAVLDRLTRGVKGNQRTRRLRASLLLGAMALVVVGGLVLLETNALRRTELGTVNTRFDIRGKAPPPSNVVLVGIDDKTFAEPPRPRWPFDRGEYAKVIRHLVKAGAKVIAFDVQISERDKQSPRGDDQLVEATRAAGNVVMATTEVGEHGESNIFFDVTTASYSRAKPGNSNYLADSDGRIRRMLIEIDSRETFPMVAAEIAEGRTIQPPSTDSAWIDFAGPAGSVNRLSFVDVRRGTFDPADVKGKVVVIGATAPTLQDLHSTATTKSGLMPGPEVHANSIATVLAGFPLRGAPKWLDWLLVIALGTITPFLALRRGIVVSVVAGLLALAAFLAAAQLAFDGGTILTVVYPVLAGLAAILATAAIHGLTVAFEREQARDAFARFVPEAVVDQVLADSDGARLGGVRGEATVMFSDLRGFTSFSESLEPERVIESLNRYLTEMSEAILDHGGTLVAYMGDGIMAVFGAPLKQDDHADRALEAARDMLGRMDGFNGWLREQDLHDGFKMGIGLNSGAVMSGNVGSERRLEYTALGDTTNTAARLEGMTKGTPHQLFISDTTKQMLTREADDLVAVGEAEVRGRKAKVLLWSLRDGDAPAPVAPPSAAVEA
jgi:adenylate cyclase